MEGRWGGGEGEEGGREERKKQCNGKNLRKTRAVLRCSKQVFFFVLFAGSEEERERERKKLRLVYNYYKARYTRYIFS